MRQTRLLIALSLTVGLVAALLLIGVFTLASMFPRDEHWFADGLVAYGLLWVGGPAFWVRSLWKRPAAAAGVLVAWAVLSIGALAVLVGALGAAAQP